MKKSIIKQDKPQQKTLADAPHHHVYRTPDFELEVTVNGEDLWLSQKDIATLFGVSVPTISEHIKGVLAADGKSYDTNHYSLDIVIPVGYRVGSPQATAFRKWANGIIKEYLITGAVINEERIRNKTLHKMERDLALFEKHNLGNRPEVQRLSRLYENKLGAELLLAIIADVCTNPNYKQIKGTEYKMLFNMYAGELKDLLGTDKIRDALPDRQLQAFTLAETTLRDILSSQKNMSNEQVIEAIRISFAPIGAYLRGVSDMLGVHHVTGQPLLGKGRG